MFSIRNSLVGQAACTLAALHAAKTRIGASLKVEPKAKEGKRDSLNTLFTESISRPMGKAAKPTVQMTAFVIAASEQWGR